VAHLINSVKPRILFLFMMGLLQFIDLNQGATRPLGPPNLQTNAKCEVSELEIWLRVGKIIIWFWSYVFNSSYSFKVRGKFMK